MLHFYPSNHSENLASVIAQIMARQPLANPFDSETILIQSQGMGTWLKQQLSAELGVAAMINTQMPASFIWRLSECLLPEEKLIPRFEKRNLRWELMRVLPSKLDDERYHAVADYLKAQRLQEGAETQLPLFQLCDRLADLYDAYQNYRSDWISSWEEGNSAFHAMKSDRTIESLEDWQADLWRSVYPHLHLQERLHRPDVLGRLLATFKSNKPALASTLPKRLFIFGLSALPPQWLPLFEALSCVIDVHFLAFNPCQQYWGDIQTRNQQLVLQKRLIEQGIPEDIAAESVYESNPLLASWGKLGRDYVSLVSSSEQISEISVDLFDAEEAACCALKAVQGDILKLDSQVHEIDAHDDSIRFAVCHSRLREIEALHDYLLDLLDRHSELEAKDIIVMMPDVQTFTPFIEAVFSRPAYDDHNQAHYLSYGISDQLFSVDQPLVDVVLDTLDLTSKRITSREVLIWLDIPAIRSRFNIEDAELLVIQHWIDALNIRWGLSESHRDGILKSAGDEKSGSGNTWLSAFHRLLAGCLYADQVPIEDESGFVLPFPIEGRDQYILVGKLIRFIDVIQASIMRISGKHSLAEWLVRVSELWQNWFDDSALPDELVRMMDSALESLEEQVQIAAFDELIKFDVVAEALKGQFQTERVSQRFLAGRINFCTLMPMRSIPFKVVCLLGMNEGEYPRIEVKTSFDLMSLTPSRLGDRSPRSDDRYLFLEAVCSAREFLYVSYCGFDLKDNSERFPSVLVSEFRDYCADFLTLKPSQSFDSPPSESSKPSPHSESSQQKVLKTLTCVHRLQPFHPDYYRDADSLLKSYCTDWLALHHQSEGGPQYEPMMAKTEELEAVQIDELVACLNHPLKFYYQNALNTHLGFSIKELPESEPFALDNLDMYQLKNDLVASWGSEQYSEQDVYDIWQLSDRLPRPPATTLDWEATRDSVHGFKQSLTEMLPFERVAFDERVAGKTLTGEFNVCAQGQVMLTLSKQVAGQFFGAWGRHVVWNVLRCRVDASARYLGESVLVTPSERYVFKALDEEQANRYLGDLLSWYQRALGSPALFLAKTAFASLHGKESEVKKAFYGTSFNGVNYGDAQDPYWLRACSLGELACDPAQIPEFTGQCLFDQVQEQLEQDLIQVSEIGND